MKFFKGLLAKMVFRQLDLKNSFFVYAKIKFEIRNQRPQKPWSTKFHENRWFSKILCPPYSVRHFEFRESDVKFIISDPESFWVQSFAEIVWFPKLHVRHIGYPPFCEGYGYLRLVRQFFSRSSTIRSPLIIVRIKSQYSFGSKKNYEKKIIDFLVLFFKLGAILDFRLDQTQFWSQILEEHTQNYMETWFSFGNFSFSVMRMRLEYKLKNCSSWSLMG